ncbi:MAG: hypothetical protein HQK76_10565 [Desulfobacterales bacterium]|nr:hypothetical protein [Desulfobacterales bacterium]
MKDRLLNNFLFFLILISGASNLIFQLVSQKYLNILLGTNNVAAITESIVFFSFLSVGYYFAGKLTVTVKNLVKLYSFIELAKGLFGLSFIKIFALIDRFIVSYYSSSPLTIAIEGMIVSSALTALPSFCMGFTIPFLTKSLTKNISQSTYTHAKVYITNIFGAFIGIILSEFYFIKSFGFSYTLGITSILNIFNFICFYFLSDKLFIDSKTSLEETPLHRIFSIYPVLILYLMVFLSGFYIIAFEKILTSITSICLGPSLYSLSITTSVFIFSIVIMGFLFLRLKNIPQNILFHYQIFIALFLVGLYFILDKWPYYAHVIRIAFQSNAAGFFAYYLVIFIILCFILVIPIGFAGIIVIVTFHELKIELKYIGNYSGTLFAINSIGKIFGSICGGIIFYNYFNNGEIILIVALLSAISALMAAIYINKNYLINSSALVFLIWILILFNPFYEETNFKKGFFKQTDFNDYSLKGYQAFYNNFNDNSKTLFYKDSYDSSIAIIESPHLLKKNETTLTIYKNGEKYASTGSDECSLKLCAHIPALLSNNKNNVLIIGLNTGITAGELLIYPNIQQIDIVEASNVIAENIPLFGKFNNNIHENNKIKIITGDIFKILRKNKKKWNIIISEEINAPWIIGSDLLFTKDFYKIIKNHLYDDGLFIQWIGTSEVTSDIFAIILKTIGSEFNYTRIFMSNISDQLILASNKDISFDDLKIADKLFNDSYDVWKSLQTIGIESLDAILLREVLNSDYMECKLKKYNINMMNHPIMNYMAAKNLFIGKPLSQNYLFNSDSAFYYKYYLLPKKYVNWEKSSFTAETINSFFFSAQDHYNEVFLPMAMPIKIKAYLYDPDLFNISEEDEKELKINLISFIEKMPNDDREWEKIGLIDTSYRKKISVLLEHTKKFRNWITPYSIEGLKDLIQDGINNGANVYEKNWCLLQYAILLNAEGQPAEKIIDILNKTERGSNNKILFIKKEDENMLNDLIKEL